MSVILTLPFFLASMILDMLARKRGDDQAAAVFQPLTTLIVVATALLSLFSSGLHHGFSFGISLGLVIAMGADMILVDRKDPVAFMKGMLLFFFVLLVYSATFIAEAGFHLRDLYAAPFLAAYYVAFIAVLWKGLGKMWIPVMIYGLAFVFCVSRAFSTFFAPGFSSLQPFLLVAGTTLFMLGDSQLAIFHFVNPKFPMFWAPAFYFVGQYLVAISASLF
jgi:Predicted membrane protein